MRRGPAAGVTPVCSHLFSVSEALKQLASLHTISQTVASLKCSIERIINNSKRTHAHAHVLVEWLRAAGRRVPHYLEHLCPLRMTQNQCCPPPGSAGSSCCPLGWDTFRSSCFLFSKSSLSWHEARDWCSSHESHLLVLNSDEEWVRLGLGGGLGGCRT